MVLGESFLQRLQEMAQAVVLHVQHARVVFSDDAVKVGEVVFSNKIWSEWEEFHRDEEGLIKDCFFRGYLEAFFIGCIKTRKGQG